MPADMLEAAYTIYTIYIQFKKMDLDMYIE